jgi:hypothetical protein
MIGGVREVRWRCGGGAAEPFQKRGSVFVERDHPDVGGERREGVVRDFRRGTAERRQH